MPPTTADIRLTRTLFGRPPPPSAGQEIPIEGDELPCPACLEKIDTRWDVHSEEWVYIAAARNDKDGQVYHFNCLDDGGHGHDMKSDDNRREAVNSNNSDVLNDVNNYTINPVERLGSLADDESRNEFVKVKSEPGLEVDKGALDDYQ